jgi:hypothetical protein
MKKIYASILLLMSFACFIGCNDKETYVDLETGKTITVVKDSTTGYMINADTREPVGIYVNNKTHDTIYGRTGKVINNMVIKTPDGKFTYQDENDVKVKVEGDGSGDGDYKKKVEKDGDIKIKDGDTKIKIEADGDKKVKKD